MTIQEALEILKQTHITDSIQMLRRWIRQGKIKATMVSKKQGYVIDETSLNDFVKKKQSEDPIQEVVKKSEVGVEKPNVTQNDVDAAWTEGYNTAVEIQEQLMIQRIKDREKELILKGLKEDSFKYSSTELLKKFPKKSDLDKHLKLLGVYSVTLNVLGNWLFDETFNILIDLDELDYPNRSMKVRAKELYTKRLFEHFESNK